MRARSCRCSGASFLMVGTQDDQSLRKGMKTTGQLVSERRSISGRRDLSLRPPPGRGIGTEGGSVVERSAAK
jgi:hypothetical protein